MSKLSEYIQMIKDGIPNIGQILEGVTNQVRMEFNTIPEDEQDEIIRRRLICETCPLMSVNAVKLGTYNTKRTDKHCTACGCPISTRTASLTSDCGIDVFNKANPNNTMPLKWEAYIKSK